MKNSSKMNLSSVLLLALAGFSVTSEVIAATKQNATAPKPSAVSLQRPAPGTKLTAEQEKKISQLLEKIQSLLTARILPPEINAAAVYDVFDFSSSKNGFFSKYNGHTNTETLGGNNFAFKGFYAGFTATSIQTKIKSKSQLSATLSQNNDTSINNALLNLHVMRMVSKNLGVDLLGGYGNSTFKIDSTKSFPTTTIANTVGSGSLEGSNAYIGARLMYSRPFKDFMLRGDLAYVYNNFFQAGYLVAYNDGTNQSVASLTTRTGLLTENVRIYYRKKPNAQPFVVGGLIQLVNRTYSNPVINASTSASLPQLVLGRNGFLVGAGLNYAYKQLRLTPYYQYSERGSLFHDNLGALQLSFVCS